MDSLLRVEELEEDELFELEDLLEESLGLDRLLLAVVERLLEEDLLATVPLFAGRLSLVVGGVPLILLLFDPLVYRLVEAIVRD